MGRDSIAATLPASLRCRIGGTTVHMRHGIYTWAVAIWGVKPLTSPRSPSLTSLRWRNRAGSSSPYGLAGRLLAPRVIFTRSAMIPPQLTIKVSAKPVQQLIGLPIWEWIERSFTLTWRHTIPATQSAGQQQNHSSLVGLLVCMPADSRQGCMVLRAHLVCLILIRSQISFNSAALLLLPVRS